MYQNSRHFKNGSHFGFDNLKNGLLDPKNVLIDVLQCQIHPFLSKLLRFLVFLAAILDLAANLENGRQKNGNIDFLFLCPKSFNLMHNMHFLPKNPTELLKDPD